MKQGELNVILIAKYPVKVYRNAKVMMYEFVLVTKQTIYVYLSWQRILMIQDAESFGFVENVTDTIKFMKFLLFSSPDPKGHVSYWRPSSVVNFFKNLLL